MTQIYGKSSFVVSLADLAKWLSVRLRTKWLWVRILFLSLKHKCLLLADFQLAENFIFLFDFYERTKRDKSEFLTKFLRITDKIMFRKKKVSHIPFKILAANYFFNDDLKSKTVKKTNGRILSVNPRSKCSLIEELSNSCDYLFRHSGFSDLFSKVFLVIF